MKSRLFLTMVLLAIATSTRVFAGAGGIDWMYDYSTGLERARIERKPVMIDFYTLWCHYCKVLDAKTYTDPSVIATAKDFVCLKINAERERQLARQFRLTGYPIIVFLSRDGIEIKRIIGYVPAATLDAALEGIVNDRGTLQALAGKYKKNPGDVEIGYLYADELMAKGQFKEAAKVLEKIVRDASQRRKADATLSLAVCRFKQGNYKSAASELAKFSNRFNSSERIDEAELFYGLSLLALSQREKGIDVLKRLQERASAKWVGQEALRQLTLAREGKG